MIFRAELHNLTLCYYCANYQYDVQIVLWHD